MSEKKPRRKSRGKSRKAPLTPRRQAGWAIALAALAEGQSNVKAAEMAGVEEITIRRWLKDERFRSELEPLLTANTEAAARILRGRGAAVADYLTGVASGRVSGSPQGVAAARDVLNRLKVGAGERLEMEGDAISMLTDEELEARAQARRQSGS